MMSRQALRMYVLPCGASRKPEAHSAVGTPARRREQARVFGDVR